MSPDARKFLWDAQQAAALIAEFVKEKSFADYCSNAMLKSAVERQFEIVGEALNALSKTAPEIAAGIPELGRIVAFRNVLIHGYATVDDRLVWGVVEGKLPLLRGAVSLLLDSVP
jgi:uncharacterized protein with HEPN domain